MLKASRGQGHGQVTWDHHEQNYMKAVWHDVWIILDVETNGNGYFNIWPEGQIKNGKTGSIFEINNFENKTLSDSVSSQEFNGVICFCLTYL